MSVELLAPAGDLEKVRFALLYGADAVYIGGRDFSLRARASNFSMEEIEEAVKLAHGIGKKIYVTMNIVFHNDDVSHLDDYLVHLEEIGVDAIICSSPIVIDRAKALTRLDIHLSTQVSLANSQLADFWHSYGVSRVVLARECTLEEIAKIKEKALPELEVFIHGGMCVSYSGRCTLSNYMTDRDANRGGCAHNCRWNYELFNNGRSMTGKPDFQMASKDLESLAYVKDLLDIGISSLKIEGRMKSIHYIATVVSAYRALIDDLQNGSVKEIEYYEQQIRRAEHRPTSSGFLGGIPRPEQQLYDPMSESPTKDFAGIVLDYDEESGIATVEQRNHFSVFDRLEIFSPGNLRDQVFNVTSIQDEFGLELDAARHPRQIIKLACPHPLQPYDILRKVF